ncbi:MAG: hypothetical protein ACXWX6_05185 [Actinomycetota bacterium]
MKRWCVVVVLRAGLVATPAAARKLVGIDATPNPASVRDRVRHAVVVGAVARLEIWVSASGFQAPGSGTLPAGTWSLECCPAQTSWTRAWPNRSSGPVGPGTYRFPAVARQGGRFLSTAAVAGASAGVWVTIR